MKKKQLEKLVNALEYASIIHGDKIENMTIGVLKRSVQAPDFDFFTAYRDIVKTVLEKSNVQYGLPIIFPSDSEPGRTAYVSDNYQKRNFVNKEYFDSDGGCFRNVVYVEMMKLYSGIFVNAFKKSRFRF